MKRRKQRILTRCCSEDLEAHRLAYRKRKQQEGTESLEDAPRSIELTRGRSCKVDAEDFEYLNQFNWVSSGIHNTGIVYAQRRQLKDYEYESLRMHRLIMNCPKSMIIDHKDHNGLNNAKSNLRICTNGQNICNSRKHKNCVSKYKGVTWNKSCKRWLAQTKFNHTQIYFGSFKTEIEAAKEYDKKIRNYHGEFSTLNFNETND